MAACCFILLGNRFQTNYPFLIAVDPITDEWNVVAYPDESQKPVQRYEIIQEKLVNDFVVNWFTVANDKSVNDARWMECSVDECGDEQFNPNNTTCALACQCDESVFKDFIDNVLPQYRILTESWRVGGKQIMPVVVSEQGGKWQVYATIQSPSTNRYFNILGFIDVARDVNLYPATFGYHIKQFNSYRITQ